MEAQESSACHANGVWTRIKARVSASQQSARLCSSHTPARAHLCGEREGGGEGEGEGEREEEGRERMREHERGIHWRRPRSPPRLNLQRECSRGSHCNATIIASCRDRGHSTPATPQSQAHLMAYSRGPNSTPRGRDTWADSARSP